MSGIKLLFVLCLVIYHQRGSVQGLACLSDIILHNECFPKAIRESDELWRMRIQTGDKEKCFRRPSHALISTLDVNFFLKMKWKDVVIHRKYKNNGYCFHIPYCVCQVNVFT